MRSVRFLFQGQPLRHTLLPLNELVSRKFLEGAGSSHHVVIQVLGHCRARELLLDAANAALVRKRSLRHLHASRNLSADDAVDLLRAPCHSLRWSAAYFVGRLGKLAA